MSEYYMIEARNRTLVATPNSMRRVYNGCAHPDDWEMGWTGWDWLQLKLSKEQAEERLKFWRDLTDYAVSERGESAKSEYRVVPDTVYDGTW